MGPSPSQPEFFLDRSLGAHDVAAALRAAGWLLRTHLEVYGGRDQHVEDVEWLELCGREGWPVLTKDGRIRYRPAELDAIRNHRVQAFALGSGNLTAAEQAALVERHREAIERACQTPGPFLYTVNAAQLRHVIP